MRNLQGGAYRSYSSGQDRSYVPYSDSWNDSRRVAGPSGDTTRKDSFHDRGSTHAPKICLGCGKNDSHFASDCTASRIASHPDRQTIITVKNRHIAFNSDGATSCFKFNLEGSCSESCPHHNVHHCTLCSATFHGALQCSRN